MISRASLATGVKPVGALGHLGQKSLSYVERVREEIPNA
jgi:hypothetical protein